MLRFALLLAGVLLAVRTVSARDLHHVTGFDEYAENHEGVAAALARQPSLASDPEFLAHHPSLAHYLHDNPLARAELESEDDEDTDLAHPGGEKDLSRRPVKLLQRRESTRPLERETGPAHDEVE